MRRHAQFPAKIGKGVVQGLKPPRLNVIKPGLNASNRVFTLTSKKADAFHEQFARRAEMTARELAPYELLKVFR